MCQNKMYLSICIFFAEIKKIKNTKHICMKKHDTFKIKRPEVFNIQSQAQHYSLYIISCISKPAG